MNASMPLLATLQSHAALCGEAFAHLLPDRVITYRRFWARIERASARLQGEWGIQATDTVAYIGNGHPDALILFCALQRLGAVLLPLEGWLMKTAGPVLRQAAVKLVIHDDGTMITDMRAHSLSSMLADWCHFDPVKVEEDPQRVGLLLPQQHGETLVLRALSLQHIFTMPGAACSPSDAAQAQQGALVGHAVFDLPTLAGVIIPALYSAQPLRFAAIEDGLQKHLVAAR